MAAGVPYKRTTAVVLVDAMTVAVAVPVTAAIVANCLLVDTEITQFDVLSTALIPTSVSTFCGDVDCTVIAVAVVT